MKMKYLYIVSALALGLIGCSQGYEDVEALLNKTMSFNIVSPNGGTRVVDGTFEAEDKLGLYVTDYSDDTTPAPLQISGNRANNVAMVFDGASWATERAVYWGDGKSDVYAYYPYMEVEDVDKQPFSVATDQTVDNAYETSDFLWAKAAGVSQSDGAVSLEMQHSMSRLVVKIMAGEEYVGSLPADATVHLHSTVTDAHISLTNGSVVKDPQGGTHSIKMRNLGIHTFAEGEAVVYEAIVVPQMLETSVPLLEINSKSVSYLLEDMFNFKPGVSYTYTAVMNTSTTAIRIDIGGTTDDWNNMGSGDGTGGDGGGTGDGEDDGIDLSTYTDLSAEGTANCYLVKAAGKYKFKAVQGNSNATVGNVKKTEVLWESFGTDVMPNVGDLVTGVGYKNGYVYFSTPEVFGNGNASIAVRNSKDVILWSWHIWCSEEGWNDQVYANNAGTMMDRNLGATSATPGAVGALGLLYQWGRKDPFLGSGDKTSEIGVSTGTWSSVTTAQTVDYSEMNPMTLINYTSSYPGVTQDWCTGVGSKNTDYSLRWMSEKTMHDPCPVGYRVPDRGNDDIWETGFVSTELDAENVGLYWTLADGSTSWYPRSADYTSYWSATPSSGENSAYSCACTFSFNSAGIYNSPRARGYAGPVRCVKE